MENPIACPENEVVDVIVEGNTENPEDNAAIDEQTQHRYRIFKKNSPYLYDYVSTTSLLWPSLTVQFFPDLEVANTKSPMSVMQEEKSPKGSGFASQLAHQRLLLGTFTLGQSIDAIHLYQVPYYRDLNKCINTDQWTYNAEKEEFELPTVSKTKIRNLQTINHNGDVNKLRYMPQNPDIIASGNNVGDLHVYNRTKHSTMRKMGDESKVNEPQVRLVNSVKSQNSDIFALDWNKQRESVLVSASMEGQVNMYDIRGSYAKRSSNDVIHESWTVDHGVGINDVEWQIKHDSVLLTADDVGELSIYDIRTSEKVSGTPATTIPKNSLSINPQNEFCVATGNSEGLIEVWDIRCLSRSAKTIQAHVDSITQIKWHPKFRAVLGSSSADRSVKLFDVAESGNELLFSHEGHMLGVNDFDWSMHEDWMVASVADDNSLHLWKPAQNVIERLYT